MQVPRRFVVKHVFSFMIKLYPFLMDSCLLIDLFLGFAEDCN